MNPINSRRSWLAGGFAALLTLGINPSFAAPAQTAKSSKTKTKSKAHGKIKPASKTQGETAFAPRVSSPAVQAFIQRAALAGVPEAFSTQLLMASTLQPSVKRYMDPPPAGARKNWPAYKTRFTDALRIRKGQAFLQNYEVTFTAAQAKYGVPPAIIAAIIGIETLYGTFTGHFKLGDVLPTLAFDYPRRAAFFQDELLSFMQLVQAGVLEHDTRGSFAGALGLPQFMPGSLQRWGASAQSAQRIDLTVPEDAITSVAAFLQGHGWQNGAPIAFEAPLMNEAKAGEFLKLDATPVYSHVVVASFAPSHAPINLNYAVVDLQHLDATHEYLLTTQNFHTIMQYNRSYFYAAAVWYLAQKLGL